MEYDKVLSSAVIGYESSDDELSEIVRQSPDCSIQKKTVTISESPQSPSLCGGFAEIISADMQIPKKKSVLPLSLTLHAPKLILHNEQRNIDTPAYSPFTSKPLLQIEQRSIEALANSPLTPKPLLLNEQRSIEALANSPLTPKPLLLNEQRSIEAPAYSPLTPKPLLLNEQRSIEAPAYSPLTPKPLLLNEQRSIEDPIYLPHTPKPLEIKSSHTLPFISGEESPSPSENNTGFVITAQLSPSTTRSVSPVPSMSPETKRLLRLLENDNAFDSDDSLKDPNYEVEEDETDCSDYEERQISFRTLTVEAEINKITEKNVQKRKAKKQNIERNTKKNRQSDDLDKIMPIENCTESLEVNVANNNARNNNTEEAHSPNSVNNLENEVTEQVSGGNIRQGRPKKGRKRKGTYSREEIKNRKFNNMPYTDRKFNLVEPKEFRNDSCSCKGNCSILVPTEDREKEFNTFMHLGSYSAQLLYITSSVQELKKKRIYQPDPTKKSKPREFTRVYKLGGKIVCKDMFLKTLQITTQKVNTALKKVRNGLISDQRGSTGGWNRLSTEEYKLAEEVINKLPKYESHYRRENTEAVYLQPGMTVRKIYEDYYIKEFNNLPDKDTRQCLKYGTFKEFFYKNFNLKCKPLKKDTCNKCDYYAISQKNGVDLQEEHSAHLTKAEGLRKQMKLDFEKAKSEPNIECLTFDLEKTLPLPKISTNVVFYKRQLWVYNSGIHRASDDKGFCYVWVEGEAGRGSQEVGSCLLQFIQNELDQNIEHLILWSDSCGGQNRNIKITLMLKAALNAHNTLKTISMRFLEPGHTFLPNDTDFSKIEMKIKEYDRIYTVEDYITVMKRCKVRNPLTVKRMKKEQFLGCNSIEQGIVNRKVFKNKKKVNWLTTKEILLKKEFNHSIFMRADFDSLFDELFIKKRFVRGGEEVEIVTTELVPLWPCGKEIAQAKLDDLKSMLHLIPADCHPFYENLKGNNQVLDDVDGFGTLPDFVIENI